ncbi:pyrophosphate--fructose 6-phosphate 1-phosphotransferase subunit beta-like [Mangifera indica]|uniref:pyrophosphate--fructose 6-phosphate 1-phosphotransferase subunit beta-like n=1 Tax=Mangifera indica TaxID=29780 RepID=UPI001CFAFDD2|nr:pyrophosphate--fructose 6-phosphate 1-phosphotransferase subunit beta-like [Mangifera indica]
MSPPLVSNCDFTPVKSGQVSGRVASVYSEVQTSRIDRALPLPSVLRNPFKIVDGPASSAAAIEVILVCQNIHHEIKKLFLNLFGQPSARLVPNDVDKLPADQKLNIGVVSSGGQAPGGHNVISGIFGEDL